MTNTVASGYLADSQGKLPLINGKVVFVYNYLVFDENNANIVERSTYTTLSRGVTVSATSSYGRASFTFPVESGKKYKIEFDSVVVDGYKKVYFHNAALNPGDGWDPVYGTLDIAVDGHKSYIINSNSTTLWIGLYASAGTTTGTITLTNVVVTEIL